jgi:hypothetical protein
LFWCDVFASSVRRLSLLKPVILSPGFFCFGARLSGLRLRAVAFASPVRLKPRVF